MIAALWDLEWLFDLVCAVVVACAVAYLWREALREREVRAQRWLESTRVPKRRVIEREGL